MGIVCRAPHVYLMGFLWLSEEYRRCGNRTHCTVLRKLLGAFLYSWHFRSLCVFVPVCLNINSLYVFGYVCLFSIHSKKWLLNKILIALFWLDLKILKTRCSWSLSGNTPHKTIIIIIKEYVFVFFNTLTDFSSCF